MARAGKRQGHLQRHELVVVLRGDEHELDDVLDVRLQVVVAHLQQTDEGLAHLLPDLFAGVARQPEERLHVAVHVGGQRGGHEEQEVVDGGQRVLAHRLVGVLAQRDEGGDHGVEWPTQGVRVQRMECSY